MLSFVLTPSLDKTMDFLSVNKNISIIDGLHYIATLSVTEVLHT